eukprot:283072-Alexandrium_andersonii.AAC.2
MALGMLLTGLAVGLSSEGHRIVGQRPRHSTRLDLPDSVDPSSLEEAQKEHRERATLWDAINPSLGRPDAQRVHPHDLQALEHARVGREHAYGCPSRRHDPVDHWPRQLVVALEQIESRNGHFQSARPEALGLSGSHHPGVLRPLVPQPREDLSREELLRPSRDLAQAEFRVGAIQHGEHCEAPVLQPLQSGLSGL